MSRSNEVWKDLYEKYLQHGFSKIDAEKLANKEFELWLCTKSYRC